MLDQSIENYAKIKAILTELVKGEKNFIANASNFSSLIYNYFNYINWCGFYMLEHGELVLSTFQGKPACLRIAIGQGACGTAAAQKKTLVVENVHEFKGHIACDSDSRSEIVLPVIFDYKLYGVLDIDSSVFNRFSSEDSEFLRNMLRILLESSDITKLDGYYNPIDIKSE
ncbi:MAG: GAF domain-containing protein [Candidatus Kapabacteria bacterium]|nr:GAF domain-containing protein [Candidatus Kapabacteria bacterium]